MTASPPADAPQRLQLNLLANGLDFIREGIEAIYGGETPTPKGRKYALLHVFSGTLLVLKERLRRGHESLIFTKVAEARKTGGGIRTVDFDEVLNRLEGAVGVEISADDKKTLRDVQTERNAIEHFVADLDLKKVDKLIGELVDFLERFLHDELSESLLTHLSLSSAEKVLELAKIAARIRERRHAEWRARAKRYQRMTRRRLEELRDEHAYHPKENPDRDLLGCPMCQNWSVAVVDGDVGVCTVWECRELYIADECARCGQTAVFDDGPHCDSCTAYYVNVMSKDD